MKTIVVKGLFFVFILFFIVSCSHSISHKPIPNTLTHAKNNKSVVLIIPSETRSYTSTYRNLSGDKWVMEVGRAIIDITPQIFRSEFSHVSVTDSLSNNLFPSKQNKIVRLTILSFEPDIGWTVFSTHNGTLTLNVQVDGTSEYIVKASGSDSSGSYLKTYSGLLLPTAGVSGYSEAMGVMISNAVTAASVKALQVVLEHKK